MTTGHQPHDADMPPMKPSKEATKEQLQIGREQGDAYARAMLNMKQETGQLVSKHVGDYEIGATTENAEGLYHFDDGKLYWVSADGENAHLEIVVRDAADGRFIPGLTVRATLYAPNGDEIGTQQLPFLWHPMLYHYGANWEVPEEGDYRVHVHVDPPHFMRHDYKNGLRYGDPADVDLTIHIKPGRKISTDQKR